MKNVYQRDDKSINSYLISGFQRNHGFVMLFACILHAFCKNQWITLVHRNTRQIQVNIKSLGLPNRLSRPEDVTHRMTLKQWETSKQTNKN